MRELSDKEIEQLYKEEKMTGIPDLWKNIERNLAPKIPKEDRAGGEEKRSRKKPSYFRFLAPAAAVLALAVLAVPAWQLLLGGSKSYDGGAPAMDSGSSNGAAPMTPEGNGMEDAAGSAAPMTPEENAMAGEDASPGEMNAEEGREFLIQAEIQVEQVQATLQGYLVTGQVLDSEENWFEAGERVTLFYEGEDYGEEDFSGSISAIVDVEEENLKILEILP